jgi:single-strand DNA-binding protein
VVCWRELAKNVALSLTKGTRVFVTGHLDQRSWETDDHAFRSKVEIVAGTSEPASGSSQSTPTTRSGRKARVSLRR